MSQEILASAQKRLTASQNHPAFPTRTYANKEEHRMKQDLSIPASSNQEPFLYTSKLKHQKLGKKPCTGYAFSMPKLAAKLGDSDWLWVSDAGVYDYVFFSIRDNTVTVEDDYLKKKMAETFLRYIEKSIPKSETTTSTIIANVLERLK